MIDEIQVKNLALIREVSLTPARGLTVLTGETGAGKTALLSALKLLMGARADKSAVRDGADALSVSGRFYVSSLEETSDSFKDAQEEVNSETELVVTRRVGADGRSRASVNGQMASAAELVHQVSMSIDLCGQHEQQQLIRTATHGSLLDAWAADSIAPAHRAYLDAFNEACFARAELDRVVDAGRASSEKLDEARFVLSRIDEVNPGENEYEELAATLSRAENAEALATAADAVYRLLGSDGGAVDIVSEAASVLDGVACHDAKLSLLVSSLREAGYALEDVAHEARSYRDDVEFDPRVLSQQQERMSALKDLLRTWGPRMEDVLERRFAAAELIALADDSSECVRTAQQKLVQAESNLKEAAAKLDSARRDAAPLFAAAVTAQMQRLEMSGAEIVCCLNDLPRESWTKVGSSSVELLFRPGANMQPRPFARIASGGEASRVMLAVKVVLGEADPVDTLVFDEVDAGVGGSAAVALAEVLSDLSQTHQVIVVTHLAQVAVRGQAHYVVRKIQGDKGMPETDLRLLDEPERPQEIARMLSGEVTETSLAHAKELLSTVKN